MAHVQYSRSERGDILGILCDDVTRQVGDGAVVWTMQPRAIGLIAEAAGHRNVATLATLRELLGVTALEPPRGRWLRQVLTSGQATRFADPSQDVLASLGLPVDSNAREVVLYPLAAGPAVLMVLRGPHSPRFALGDRRRLAALAGASNRRLRDHWRGEAAWARAGADALDLGADLREQTTAAIWSVDPEGAVTNVNQAACDLVGLASEQLLGEPISRWMSVPELSDWSSFEGVDSAEAELMRADGSRLWVEVGAKPLLGPDGANRGAVYTVHDVHRRRTQEISTRVELDLMRSLTSLSAVALEGEDLDGLAQRAVRMLASQFGAPLIALARVSRDRGEVTTIATAGELSLERPELWRGVHSVPLDSATRAAVDAGEVVRVDSFEADDFAPGPISEAADAASVACAPISGGSGCIAVLRPDSEAIGDGELLMLEEVARILGARWT